MFTRIVWQPGSANTGFCSSLAISSCNNSGVHSANTLLCDTLLLSQHQLLRTCWAGLWPWFRSLRQIETKIQTTQNSDSDHGPSGVSSGLGPVGVDEGRFQYAAQHTLRELLTKFSTLVFNFMFISVRADKARLPGDHALCEIDPRYSHHCRSLKRIEEQRPCSFYFMCHKMHMFMFAIFVQNLPAFWQGTKTPSAKSTVQHRWMSAGLYL